eukprot:CAMPEP_0198323168 /NCGR_PEP_ID=MMETSP1450-20131203/11484_1 /TAXON_ID=753684 ORGANISM="Madagascaria erythrocladiodes, Strain CCMP3234" /NCGR_SAMPLE_ID=MMETSP1450 /ASSEMBLY_ACC=CAM_ASM_001115 /LENGTH=274 /DNA_ID=CAMNT_0044026849 /DNA_START=45 /DNA_END=869 /DNA_ORIENTATION=+
MTASCFITPALPLAAQASTRAQWTMRASRPSSRRGVRRFGSAGPRHPGTPSGRGGAGAGAGAGAGSRGGSGGTRRRMGDGAAADGGGAGGIAALLGGLWAGYNGALESAPILTKAMTSLVGFLLGDLLAQKLLGDTEDFDKARLARMAAFGFVVHGPVGHYFYGALDRLLPGTEAWKVISKVAIDQIAWAPCFTVIFFSFLGALEGKSKDEIVTKIKNDTWTGVTGSWKVWPLVHTINFRFIPTEQRLLYINTIQVAYNVFLSFIGNKDKDKDA